MMIFISYTICCCVGHALN